MKLKGFFDKKNKGCFNEITKIKSKLTPNFLVILSDPGLSIHVMIDDSIHGIKEVQQILSQ